MSLVYYEFLDNVIIGGFRIIVNLMLCYLFIAISIKQTNAIYQIDSLGKILIVKQARSKTQRETDQLSETMSTNLHPVSYGSKNHVKAATFSDVLQYSYKPLYLSGDQELR
jgi:hypothetical protein